MVRLRVLTPTAAPIRPEVLEAFNRLDLPDGAERFFVVGETVDAAYNIGFDGAEKYDYVLTVEDDNIPPADGYTKLRGRLDERPDLSGVSGLYWTKGTAGLPQIWDAGGCPIKPKVGELVECAATGMGFALWRGAMFADGRLRRPMWAYADGLTPDMYFWSDAGAHGYRCAVDCDVLVGHIDRETGEVW